MNTKTVLALGENASEMSFRIHCLIHGLDPSAPQRSNPGKFGVLQLRQGSNTLPAITLTDFNPSQLTPAEQSVFMKMWKGASVVVLASNDSGEHLIAALRSLAEEWRMNQVELPPLLLFGAISVPSNLNWPVAGRVAGNPSDIAEFLKMILSAADAS